MVVRNSAITASMKMILEDSLIFCMTTGKILNKDVIVVLCFTYLGILYVITIKQAMSIAIATARTVRT